MTRRRRFTDDLPNTLRGDRCRCTACGELFTTTRNFDRHRVGKYPQRRCAEPSSVGLVLNARGFWSRPPRASVNGEIYSRRNSTSGDLTEAAMEVLP